MKHPSASIDREVAKLATKPIRHAVGFGVHLQMTNAHAQSWVFRHDRLGLMGMIGLGSRNEASLAKAREAGQRYRTQLREGVDPQLTIFAVTLAHLNAANVLVA